MFLILLIVLTAFILVLTHLLLKRSYIYIYIYRERERERERCWSVFKVMISKLMLRLFVRFVCSQHSKLNYHYLVYPICVPCGLYSILAAVESQEFNTSPKGPYPHTDFRRISDRIGIRIYRLFMGLNMCSS